MEINAIRKKTVLLKSVRPLNTRKTPLPAVEDADVRAGRWVAVA